MTAVSPALPLQEALYARLSGDAALTALADVYDEVPEDASGDYVVLGESYELPDNTHGGHGSQTVITLNVWTRARGHKPGLAIEAEIRRLLDHRPDDLDVDGHHVVSIRHDYQQTMRPPDPRWRRVQVRYRIETEQDEE